MQVVLLTLGTDGDVFPYVGVGAALRGRGHRITLMANGQHDATAERYGFAFRELVSAKEHDELFGHRDFWNPFKTAILTARWGKRFLRRQHETLSKIVEPGAVLVANPAVLAASIVNEQTGTPWTNLVLQPWTIPSSIAPPLMPYLSWLAHAPRPAWKAFWRGLDLMVDTLLGREVNALRARLGLPPRSRLFGNWLSRQLAIGMFPEWYGAPQADWPRQLRLVGFPMFDGNDEMPGAVADFCRAGEPPVAFTFGTGMAHCAERFRAALRALDLLGERGLFLTKFRDQLPSSLPRSVMHCPFAPFQQLFPMCKAVVHHGGIGTVARSLAAGTPQLIHPICFDQFDNAARVQRLGAGRTLRRRRASADRIAAALAPVLDDARSARAREVAERFRGSNALEAAADLIEALARATPLEPITGMPVANRDRC